ncbi:MAG: nucleotidyl transferase AbiEii/AbiGii toxin family protein [Deltaproteobacteria bacterium]|jgi:hypothetical protein
MPPRSYATPLAFKQALESRLKEASSSGADFARRRQLLVFDRFLARVAQTVGDAVTLKGGLVLELRLARARTTKDVDLRMMGAATNVREELSEAGRLDLGDFMRFEVAPDPRHPDIQTEGMKYEGHRFRAECRLAGKIYGQPFGVDVAFGDPIVGEPDIVVASDTLGFASIPPPQLRLYPVVSHVAEKLHAYTLPRSQPNTRVKDLPDLALLGTVEDVDAARLRAALTRTFEHRATHPLPAALPEPPAAWAGPYRVIARASALPWPELGDVHTAAAAFLNPVLAGAPGVATWNCPGSTWT